MIDKLKKDLEALKIQKEELIKSANLQIAQLDGAIAYIMEKLKTEELIQPIEKENIYPLFKGVKIKKERKARTKKTKIVE